MLIEFLFLIAITHLTAGNQEPIYETIEMELIAEIREELDARRSSESEGAESEAATSERRDDSDEGSESESESGMPLGSLRMTSMKARSRLDAPTSVHSGEYDASDTDSQIEC